MSDAPPDPATLHNCDTCGDFTRTWAVSIGPARIPVEVCGFECALSAGWDPPAGFDAFAGALLLGASVEEAAAVAKC